MKLDPAVKKETGYIAAWVAGLSLVMQLVFIVISKWNAAVLTGNLAGAAVAIGNYALLAMAVVKAVNLGDPEKAALQIRSSRTLRLLGAAGVCALCIGALKTNPFATLIPLLFPRIGLAFRPMIDRKRGVETPEEKGSEPLD